VCATLARITVSSYSLFFSSSSKHGERRRLFWLAASVHGPIVYCLSAAKQLATNSDCEKRHRSGAQKCPEVYRLRSRICHSTQVCDIKVPGPPKSSPERQCGGAHGGRERRLDRKADIWESFARCWSRRLQCSSRSACLAHLSCFQYSLETMGFDITEIIQEETRVSPPRERMVVMSAGLLTLIYSAQA
jgi:hypothetical protein